MTSDAQATESRVQLEAEIDDILARVKETRNPVQEQNNRKFYGARDQLNQILRRNNQNKMPSAASKYTGYSGLVECVDRLVDIQKEMELQLREEYSFPLRFANSVREFWYSRVLGKPMHKPTIEELVTRQLDNLDDLNGNLHTIIDDSEEVYTSLRESWQNVHNARQTAIGERKRLESEVQQTYQHYKQLEAIVTNMLPEDERFAEVAIEYEGLYDRAGELEMYLAQEEQNIVFKTRDIEQIGVYKDLVRKGLKASRDIYNQLGNFADSLRKTKQVFGLVQRQAGTVEALLGAFDATTGYVAQLVKLSGETIKEMSYVAANEQRGWDFPSYVTAQLRPYVDDITTAANRVNKAMHETAVQILSTPGGGLNHD